MFKDYAKTLEKIAYILSPDLHRFMDKESQVRAFSKLSYSGVKASFNTVQETSWKNMDSNKSCNLRNLK